MSRTAIEIICFVAVIAGFFYTTAQFKGDLAEQDRRSVRDAQAGCERSNVGLRRPLYDFITDAMKTRSAQARASTGAERVANEVAADRYRHRRVAMVNAVEDVAKAPGSPEVDCQSAFPSP